MMTTKLALASLSCTLSLAPLGFGQAATTYIGGVPVGQAAMPATSTSASGPGCPLLSSCPHPNFGSGGLGVAPDGSIWVGTFNAGSSVYNVDPATCTVLSQIPGPPFSGGLTHDGTDIWVVFEQLGEAHRLDPVTGNLLQVLPLPGIVLSDPNSAGIAWDGQAFWHVEYFPGAIYRLDPVSGAVLQTVPAPTDSLSGIEYSNGLLLVGDFNNNLIYTIDPSSGAIVDTCTGSGRPWGLGQAGDGLWTSNGGLNPLLTRLESDLVVGTNYCGPAVANSTGQPGHVSADGSASVPVNDLTLISSALPPSSFGFSITSQTQGFVMNPGGSQGHLCLGGAVGRFVGPGQIQQANASGEIRLTLDNMALPTPTGLVAANPGESWNFQTWYRDSVSGVPTSNFTDGLEVGFY